MSNDTVDSRQVVMDLLRIAGGSGQETQVLAAIERKLLDAGLDPTQMRYDEANTRAGFGEVGNLIVTLPGTISAPRRLLMAHVDTVPLCLGAVPLIDGEYIVSESAETALGGDDRSGAAVVLTTLLRILNERPEHPPLTFLWTIQEEIGLVGARYVDPEELNHPELCFNFDGGPPHSVIRGATGDSHMDIIVRGLASHAGAHPEQGISAIVIASMAIAELQRDGWLGLIEKSHGRGTSNIGYISGGAATNVVTDLITIRAEARSHDPQFRQEIVDTIQRAFVTAAETLANAAGAHGTVEFKSRSKYEAFALEEDSAVVTAAKEAARGAGLTPETRISNGGLDANWISSHGLPTVTIGCGQEFIHTVSERLHLPSFENACEIAWRLALDNA
ncbi:M20/M25/M40 family metallo-hydrolase [Rubinisphaera margarita]|uniref:M20/M25/M40 family metallo-hydrolase n=1 Tax=Rubinisphaera margarita TaxID=2909586 RepID=UPI001EE855DC|nr:M20/M25/M40 family metallo-hydrolase [Rubinisphaera margarita]MCG6156135.1 M20/M25/M40 family metallo-hydrolase [Rubinisphaera margarita]